MYTKDVSLTDVKAVAERNNLTLQQALNAIRKSSKCKECHKNGLLEYYHSSGIVYSCLFCDHSID